MNNAHEYYLSVIGKGFDEDRAFGVQCVDGFKHFCRTVLGLNLGTICNPTGLAHSIWDNFERLGLNKYFDKVPVNQMADGDWAIWAKGSRSCPSSHIAMFRLDNGNGTGIFLGQNQVGGPGFNQINISYSGIRGALRPKKYHQSQPQVQGNGSQRNYVNLPASISSWRFYDLNVAPIKKNAKGTLKPSKFGGLSYYVHEYRDGGSTAVIETVQFGKVKIYIKDTCAKITVGSYQYQSGNH